MEWKQTIFNQLQKRNRYERDIYAEIVKHYNRLIENYSIILLRCTDQEQETLNLRQEIKDLQIDIHHDPTGNDEFQKLKIQYMKAKDEILTLLREIRDMSKEVIGLSRIVEDKDEKIYSEENKNQILVKENTSLKQRVEAADEQLYVLKKVKETINDEFQALQLAFIQLEKRQVELNATNVTLREELTKKFEIKCHDLNNEVEEHQNRTDAALQRDLDEAKNDVTISNLASIA